MPIIREFRCNDCGTTFESMERPEDVCCPTCTAQEPERVFLTAPSIRSDKTTRSDQIVKELASDFGISNMTNKGGEAVKKTTEAAQFSATNNPMFQRVASMGSAADNFSPLMGTLRQAGNPRSWNKVKGK
jgi:putative FmdB family regulatory protein